MARQANEAIPNIPTPMSFRAIYFPKICWTKGPHDFAVHLKLRSSTRRQSVRRIPLPTSVAQAVAIATSKGVERMLSRSLPASQNGPIRNITRSSIQTHLLAQSPRRYNGSEEFTVVTVESISLRLRWSVGLVDLYAGSSDPGSSAEAHDLKEAEAKTLLDSLQRWCVRVTKLRRNFVSCDDLRENGLCRRGTAALVVIDTRRNGVDCVDPPSAAKLEQRRMANEGTH